MEAIFTAPGFVHDQGGQDHLQLGADKAVLAALTLESAEMSSSR